MRTPISRVLPLVVLVAWTVSAAQPVPTESGLDAQTLKEIPGRLQRFIDDGTIAGAVTLVAQRDRIARLDAIGQSDLATKRLLRSDDLFWIASMTKPITATAVLMLQDEGKLSIDDPVEKHLPEFKSQRMVESRSGETLTLRPAPRPITLRDLLTHTSGLGDVAAPRPDSSLAELVMAYAQQPLQFPPGSKWQYSNPGMNTLGRIIEVVSGQPYADFLEHRVFRALGMNDTTFWPSGGKLKRIAKSYQPRANGGGLEEVPVYFIQGELADRRRTAFPAGGLFSTAADLARFYQMMINGGTWKGRRFVSAAAVALMTRTQTGELKTGFTDGMSFGLGWAVVKEPTGVTAMLSPGTFGHGGAYGTQGWIDPKQDLILILMIQRAKLPNADASDVRRAFQEAAVGAVIR